VSEPEAEVIPLKNPIARAGVVEIFEVLGTIKGAFDEVIHRWKAAALRRQFKDLAETIVEFREDIQKLVPKEFQEQREALCRTHAAKNKEGAPIVANNSYIIDPAKQSEFDTALGELRIKHKDSIDKYDDEIKKINAFLRADIEMPKTDIRFKLSWFNTSATQEMLEVLFPFIDDDSADTEAKKAAAKPA